MIVNQPILKPAIISTRKNLIQIKYPLQFEKEFLKNWKVFPCGDCEEYRRETIASLSENPVLEGKPLNIKGILFQQYRGGDCGMGFCENWIGLCTKQNGTCYTFLIDCSFTRGRGEYSTIPINCYQPLKILETFRLTGYPDLPIFYEYKGEVWQFNPKSNLKKKIAQGGSPIVSPDKTKIAYIRNAGIYIFNLLTHSEKLLKQYPESYIFGPLGWSPDSKYLVVDTGSSPIRGKTIIDISSQKEISFFITLDDAYGWISDNEIVFTEVQPPYDVGGYGIAIINLKGEKKILKKATSKKDYLFLQIIDDKIYFSLTEVKSDEGWRDETKQAVSYWTMDKFGNNLVEIKRIEPLEEKIKKLLPSNYKGYFVRRAVSLNENKKWAVFVLDRGRISEGEIFIMNLNQPNSIKRIGKGISPSW